MRHTLKIWPGPFALVRAGEKTHEIRRADRPFAAGDELQLCEWEPARQAFTGQEELVQVTHVTHGGEWDIPPELCVMSIRRLVPVALPPQPPPASGQGGRLRLDTRVFALGGRQVLLVYPCLKCGESKPLDEFGLRSMPNGELRNQPQCRRCRGAAGGRKVMEAKAQAAAPDLAARRDQALEGMRNHLEQELARIDQEDVAPAPLAKAGGDHS